MDGKTVKILDRLLDEGIKPHATEIAEIVADGDLAALMFEPSEQAKQAVQSLGWDGQAAAFKVAGERAKALAVQLRKVGDTATAAWLERKQPGRILVFTGDGTLCVNFQPGGGFSIEPGTLDAATLN